MTLISTFDPDYEDDSWKWAPPYEERMKGWWDECSCSCHRFRPGTVMHVMACCNGGWKLSFKGLIEKNRRREAEQDARARKSERANLYKPTHGGYPSVEG